MTESDERELRRLAAMLEAIDGGLEDGSPLREALQKAGLALGLGFSRGQRPEIERLFEQLDAPLSEADRAQLRAMGLDPDGE